MWSFLFQVLCVITVPIVLIIKSQQDASFAFVALAIILCSILSLGLIFGPKVRFTLLLVSMNKDFVWTYLYFKTSVKMWTVTFCFFFFLFYLKFPTTKAVDDIHSEGLKIVKKLKNTTAFIRESFSLKITRQPAWLLEQQNKGKHSRTKRYKIRFLTYCFICN